ncbi:MAG: malonyl-ACP O-methyltransferase BioC [Lysobacteraceae bacterium]
MIDSRDQPDGALDRQRIRRSFARAAAGYESVAALQREVESRLLEQCEALGDAIPQRLLDLGCGPGRAGTELVTRWPRADLLSIDLALPMLRLASHAQAWWQRAASGLRGHGLRAPVCADAVALPLVDASLDLIFASLCLQWVFDLPRALIGINRILRPGGLLLFTTFGPDTLIELREAFALADAGDPVLPFAPMQAVGNALLAAGFRDPVLHREHFTLTYPEPRALMRELRTLGASNARVDRRRTLTGKTRMQRVFDALESMRVDGVIPSTWEVIYAQAFAPPPGQPLREGDASIARFPAASIPIRRR